MPMIGVVRSCPLAADGSRWEVRRRRFPPSRVEPSESRVAPMLDTQAPQHERKGDARQTGNLVGREAELDDTLEYLGVVAGRRRAVLVTGEPRSFDRRVLRDPGLRVTSPWSLHRSTPGVTAIERGG